MSTAFHQCPTMDYARGLTQYRTDTLEKIEVDLAKIANPDRWEKGRLQEVRRELNRRKDLQ
jgi:hypothetical protein